MLQIPRGTRLHIGNCTQTFRTGNMSRRHCAGHLVHAKLLRSSSMHAERGPQSVETCITVTAKSAATHRWRGLLLLLPLALEGCRLCNIQGATFSAGIHEGTQCVAHRTPARKLQRLVDTWSGSGNMWSVVGGHPRLHA